MTDTKSEAFDERWSLRQECLFMYSG